MKAAVFAKLADILAPDGMLVLGATEAADSLLCRTRCAARMFRPAEKHCDARSYGLRTKPTRLGRVEKFRAKRKFFGRGSA